MLWLMPPPSSAERVSKYPGGRCTFLFWLSVCDKEKEQPGEDGGGGLAGQERVAPRGERKEAQIIYRRLMSKRPGPEYV